MYFYLYTFKNKILHLYYLKVLIYIIISICLSFLIFFLSIFFGKKKPDFEKASSYECGFENFSDARLIFDIKFYRIALLFLIFDLEIAFLFPWCYIFYTFFYFNYFIYFIMMFFLYLLTIGFFYEWFSGALNWN